MEKKLIDFQNICKDFKLYKKQKGVKGYLTALFKREKVIVKALNDVSFQVNEGEIVGYIGPNGAGKSTTIKIMSGILTPTSGECTINGLVPWKNRKEYVKNIGVVFGQRSQLWWDLPILDSFELLRDLYKIPQSEYEETLELLTKTLSLDKLLSTPLRQLSLGQKMKCELAGSLLHRPKILFLDEPTIGLDAVTKLAVREFIKKINKEWKTTIILTTHDMNDIDALTDKIILIGKGQILFNGNFNDIKKKYGKTKTITLEFAKEYDKIEVDGYHVLEHNKNTAVLQNNDDVNFSTKEFFDRVSKLYEVVDFSVSTLSVDEVLASLYRDLEI